jgi:hypothetical protein
LRNTGLLRFSRDGADNRQWDHLPQNNYDEEEELSHLNTWTERNEEVDESEQQRHYANYRGHS